MVQEFNVPPGLQRQIAQDIEGARSSSEGIAASLNALTANARAAGHPVASGAIESFLSAWSAELGSMNVDAQTLIQHLQAAQAAYDETDEAIGEAAR